ncbi:MAG: hypothetical protein JSR58_02915 [Verrucomicrobia bacterium]|nr:hypothetical protein [Verrucomicrobiota bacterium]
MKIRSVFATLLMPLFLWSGEIITPTLLDLLKTMEVSHDGTLPSIVQATQAKWLRPANKERWEVDELYADKREEILSAADKLGFIQEYAPQKKHYDYAIVLGAATGRMAKRVDHLAELYLKGIRFDQVVVLTGARPLDPKVDTLFEGCATESDAIRVIWKEANLPEGMRTIPVTFVDTPMIKTAKGERRPNTTDTIVDWMSRSPKVGSCLVISNQPYVRFQDATVRAVCPQFSIETVGKGAIAENQKSVDIIDSIAKWLYGENLIVSKK